MKFRLYTVYNKHDDDKNWRSDQRKIASDITSARIIFLPTIEARKGLDLNRLSLSGTTKITERAS